jgi:hypothetical protein
MAPVKKTPKAAWAVVVVIGGFPTFVEVYREEKTARKREGFFRKGLREDYDELGVFEVEIGSAAPNSRR